MQYYSAIKKEWNNAIWSNMDGPRGRHTKWSKSDREGEISYDNPGMWNLKRNYTNELKKQKLRLKKTNFGWWQKIWGKSIVREFGMDMYMLLYLKRITNKDLLYSPWNSAQCYVATWMRGEFSGEWMHVWLSPFTVLLKLSQQCYTPI